ncbi:MAG: LysM peptidoglycan-binding domain-containing protein [Treponema sp.]|jgi:nucleoid-associated protein YgaU|nr:LysM peptidoglycan-binding domain-containing protein [Treponema sp.]
MKNIIRWGIPLILCCVPGIDLFSQVKKLEELEDYRQFQYYYELANKNNNEQNYAAGLLNVEKVWDFISRLEDLQKAWEEENRAQVEESERKLEDMGREVENAAKETRLALFMDAVVQAEEEARKAQEEVEREKAAQAQALARAEEASRRAEEAAKRLDEARLALLAVQKEEAEYAALAESGIREIERKTALAAEAESKAEEQKRIAQENLAAKQRIETALNRTMSSEEANVDQSKREFEAQSAEADRVIQQARLQAQLLSNQLHARDALERTRRGQNQVQAGAPNVSRTVQGTDAAPPPDDSPRQGISPPVPAPWHDAYPDPPAEADQVVGQAQATEGRVQDQAPVPQAEVYNQPVAGEQVAGQAQTAEGRVQDQASVPQAEVYNQPAAQNQAASAQQSGAYVLPLAIRSLEEFPDSERGRIRILEPAAQVPPAAPNAMDKAQIQFAAKYVVKTGDTLWKIAALEFIYNDGNKAGSIFNANKDIISDPNRIEPGMVLTIPSIAGEARSGTR